MKENDFIKQKCNFNIKNKKILSFKKNIRKVENRTSTILIFIELYFVFISFRCVTYNFTAQI